mmetsp:Transcript_26313/g.55756  ORF Transcript_26313/g.55756 Transcript_26313/m.55756 type:complete len:88 (-) Transcript_26313:10-273(-)
MDAVGFCEISQWSTVRSNLRTYAQMYEALLARNIASMNDLSTNESELQSLVADALNDIMPLPQHAGSSSNWSFNPGGVRKRGRSYSH